MNSVAECLKENKKTSAKKGKIKTQNMNGWWKMKVSVYILVQVEKGEPWRVATEILKFKGVKTAHTVTGQYDIIVFAELKELDLLKDIVKQIHHLEGVKHTQTAVCIPWSKWLLFLYP